MKSMITPMTKLQEELEVYQKMLEEPLQDNPVVLKEQAIEASTIISRTGKMLADSKFWLREAQSTDLVNMLKELSKDNKVYTSTAINQIISAACRNEHYVTDWCERLNNSATKRHNLSITLISLHKAEMQQNQTP